MKKALIFDVDGVLLDSLSAHLTICKDLARKYSLNLEIPNKEKFTENIVRKGIEISPMKSFFVAVGFDEKNVEKANDFYTEHFSKEYEISAFEGVDETLKRLKENYALGIVTSNVLKNISGSLGSSLDYFDDNLVLAKDSFEDYSKVKALNLILERSGLNKEDVVYFGDQIADFRAAKEVGIDFIGTTYGWGITEEDKNLELVNDFKDLKEKF